jgi:hypothetical protein
MALVSGVIGLAPRDIYFAHGIIESFDMLPVDRH